MGLEWIVGGVVGLLAGIGGGFYARVAVGKRKLHEAENRAKGVLDDAESKAKTIKKEAELEAKDTQLKAKANFEREFSEKQREIHNLEKRLQAKEDNLEKKFNLLETKEEDLFKQEKGIADKKEQLGVLERQYQELILETRRALERAAGITTDDAKKQLKESLVEDAKRESATMMMKI